MDIVWQLPNQEESAVKKLETRFLILAFPRLGGEIATDAGDYVPASASGTERVLVLVIEWDFPQG